MQNLNDFINKMKTSLKDPEQLNGPLSELVFISTMRDLATALKAELGNPSNGAL